jgi:two-component system CheB/CheR fusion protein
MGGRTVGCLTCHAVGQPQFWQESDISFVRIVAEIITHAVFRRHAEDSLKHNEMRYRLVIAQATDAILLFGADGRVREANDRAAQILGQPTDGLLGQPVWRFLPRGSAAQLPALLRRLRAGATLVFTRPLRTAAGGRVEAEARIRMLDDGRILAILRDISDRRAMERQILDIASREQIRIGQDLHDSIGQQLTGVSYMLGAVATDLDAEGNLRAREVDKIMTLVQKTIAHTRFVARGLAPVSIAGSGLTEALQSLASDTRDTYDIACRFDQRGPEIRNDRVANQLHQIALEAIHNAVRHGRPTAIRVLLEVRAGEGRLEIRDNGRGMAGEGRTGRGMGLRVMQHRAESIGGGVRFVSGRGRGTRVTVTFRLADGLSSLDESPLSTHARS